MPIYTFEVTNQNAPLIPNQPAFQDIQLTVEGDLDLSTGDLVVMHDLDAVAQDLLVRLQFFYGEWFMDTTQGIPYYQNILVKNPNQNQVRGIFEDTILGTPGVVSFNNFNFQFNAQTRELGVRFTAVVSFTNLPLNFNQTLTIPQGAT